MDIADNGSPNFLNADEIDAPLLDADVWIDGSLPVAGDKSSTLPASHVRQADNNDELSLPTQPGNDDSIQGESVNIRNHLTIGRPPLARESSIPAPLQPPPPPPPPLPQATQHLQDEGAFTQDSLSLQQLRKYVTEMPKADSTPYAFTYADASSLPEEVEEWFDYTLDERVALIQAQATFAHKWQRFNQAYQLGDHEHSEERPDWTSSKDYSRKQFWEHIRLDLYSSDADSNTEGLMCLLYLVLGVWNETAGLVSTDVVTEPVRGSAQMKFLLDDKAMYQKSSLQLKTIHESLYEMNDHIGFQVVLDIMRDNSTEGWANNDARPANRNPGSNISFEELHKRRWCCLTILHTAFEVARLEKASRLDSALAISLMKLDPDLLSFLTPLVAKMRWEDSTLFPLSKVLALYRKAILVYLGGTTEAAALKSQLDGLSPQTTSESSGSLITASPLDYHFFRQEITSKYPAFDPPPPLFPFESDSNSILPPLLATNGKTGFSLRQDYRTGTSTGDGAGTSIFHQPVHIATPAPSPPPSPIGPGGKLGKKQNYQTNQLFPFLYPPLVPTSNDIGGKGSTEMQDLLVGRRWEGSDVPTSILEAADLFANRMRTTRAMKQLWQERIRYLKFERGYDGIGKVDPLCANDMKVDLHKDLDNDIAMLDENARGKLDRIESFYALALPDLQSIVIVLLKVLLTTVTNLVTKGNGPDSLAAGFQSPDINDHSNAEGQEPEGAKSSHEFNDDALLREVDSARAQEITSKTVSGILLLLLKWLKLSHVLKFEYFSQLLLDSNYIQLVLKLFTHQELERAVNHNSERKNLNFFHFCQIHSKHGQIESSDHDRDDSSIDGAVPPPIKTTREEVTSSNEQFPLSGSDDVPRYPEVDELGIPVADIPLEPITDFSWRNFYSSINFLRVMQKICKAKAHRNMLMVQYKYSNILKKTLKVPQPDLRLYTLKIIKGQVPYCNRKWRQANMRIITAIYLHCRPELRDDWLAGIDVDAEMLEALPQEQALRALTHWYNLKRYSARLGIQHDVLDKDQDFFLKELENLGSDGDGSVDLSMEDASNEGNRWDGSSQMDSF